MLQKVRREKYKIDNLMCSKFPIYEVLQQILVYCWVHKTSITMLRKRELILNKFVLYASML